MNPPRRRPSANRMSVQIEDDDGESLDIPLRVNQRSSNNHVVRDVTDDLSSLSFSRTLSPRRPTPPVGQTTYDSPVSGFEGMARELRKEFERITAGTTGRSPRSTYSHFSFPAFSYFCSDKL